MGYYTNFEVSARGFKSMDEVEHFKEKFFAITDRSYVDMHTGYDSLHFSVEETKWYGHKSELEALSKAFPHTMIEVDGEGEDGAQWKMRVKNGSSEKVDGALVFMPFKNILK